MNNLCAVFLLAGALLGGAFAEDGAPKLLKLSKGINTLDLNADGRTDTVVIAHRDNWNAHGFLLTTIYMPHPPVHGASAGVHVVPVEVTLSNTIST